MRRNARQLVDENGARALERLASARTMSDAISVALEETPALSSASAVGVYLFEGGSLEVHARGAPDRAVSQYLALPAGSDPLLARMLQTRAPVHDQSIFTPREWRRHPLYQCAAGPFGFEHYLVAPLIGRGELIGALTLARSECNNAFAQKDLTAIAMTTAYLSVALAYSRRCESSVLSTLSRLTQRQEQIAMFVAKGLGNYEIARQLGISENTVKKHLKIMFANLGVSRRAELAWLVTLGGLV